MLLFLASLQLKTEIFGSLSTVYIPGIGMLAIWGPYNMG